VGALLDVDQLQLRAARLQPLVLVFGPHVFQPLELLAAPQALGQWRVEVRRQLPLRSEELREHQRSTEQLAFVAQRLRGREHQHACGPPAVRYDEFLDA
jgi:hypothetical protein